MESSPSSENVDDTTGGKKSGKEDEGTTEYLEALINHGNNKKQGSAFLEKLYEILMDDQFENYITWCTDGKSILIKRVEEFSQIVLPKFFKHNNFQSFVRQLNMYNFTKTSHDANRREFKQPLFRKGKRNLLPLISRKTKKPPRSYDSAIEGMQSVDMAVSHERQRLEGKPLSRCKTIDNSSLEEKCVSRLWGVIEDLNLRVKTLEAKIDQREYCCDMRGAECCCHCGCSGVKKERSNSDNTSFSTLSDERNSCVKGRSRAVSFSSCDSSVCQNTLPHAKRGVDAILSAAEIIHDGIQTSEANFRSKMQKASTNDAKSPPNLRDVSTNGPHVVT